ncbi:MAG: WD40 repeat domain-containing protein [Acidimicrobiales bacterium]
MTSPADVHSAIVDALVAIGNDAWDVADPYLLRHLPAHAERAGRATELLALDRYPLMAEPAALRTALLLDPADPDAPERRARETYLRISHEFTDARPADRAPMLSFTSMSEQGPAPVTRLGSSWSPVAVRYRPTNFSLPLTGHTDRVSGVAFGSTPDGRLLLASASADDTVRVWDPATGTPVGQPLTGHTSSVSGVAFGSTPDGRLLLASASWDDTVRVWDPATGTPVGPPLTGHTDSVYGVAFGSTPDGRLLLASASADDTVRVWDPDAFDHTTVPPPPAPVAAGGRRILTGHTSIVSGVAFGSTPDGRLLLASASADATVRVWDPATGTPVGQPLTGHTNYVSGVAFGSTPDGRLLLASASRDHTVRVWDPATGTPVGPPLTGHTSRVSGVAFGSTPDGRLLLASASWDATVRVWDPTTGTPVARIPLLATGNAVCGTGSLVGVATSRGFAVLELN